MRVSLQKMIMRRWMQFGHFLGDLQARILLFLLFYLIITPMGLIWRIISKDPLDRKWTSQSTYLKQPDKMPPDHWQRLF